MDLLGRLTIAFGVDLSDLDAAGSRLQQIGSQFTQLGTVLTAGVTAPIVGLGAAALAAAVQFETAMVKVAKTVDSPAPAIEALGVSLKKLSESTGTSVVELARIAEIGGQMNIAAEDLDDFTETIAALGVATELSTDAAAEGLAKFSNVMGTSIDDVDRLGAALVALGNKGSSSEAQILALAQNVVAAGNQVGLAESEVLAFGSALSDLGIDAEAGGTAISKLFLNMQSDVATGGGNLKEFAEIAGVTVQEFSDLFRKDAASAVLEFVKGLGAMDKESGEAIVALNNMDITEVRLRNSVLSLAAGHDVLADALKTGAKGWEENTALMDEASEFYASTGQQLEGLKNKAINVAGELGRALIPAFKAVIAIGDDFLEFVRSIVAGFTELPVPVQTTIVAFAGLLAAWGPVLIAAGALATLFASFAGVAFLLGTSIGVVAAAFVGIPAVLALVVGAGVALVRNWDQIKESVTGLISRVHGLDAVVDVVRSVAASVLAFAESILGAMVKMGTAFLQAADHVDVLVPPLKRVGTAILDMISIVGRAVSAFGNLVASLLNFGLAVAQLVAAIVTPITKLLEPALAGIAKIFGAAFGAVVTVVTRALEGVVELVVGLVSRIISALGPIANIADFVAGGLDKFTALFRDAADEIVGHSIVPDMVAAIGDNFARLDDLMVTPSQRAAAAVTEAFRTIENPTKNKEIKYTVSIDPTQLYGALIAAGQTAAQRLQLIAAASEGLANGFQNQLAAAQNEHDVRVAATEAIAAQTRRQELLALVVGDNTEAFQRNVSAVAESQVRHNALSRTLELANESTQHLTATQTQAVTAMDHVWSAAGSVVDRAGSNLSEAFSTLKGGAIGLLERFSPLGIASAAMTKAFEKLEPVLKPFEQIIEILADVIAAAILPILRVMFPIIKLLAIAFTFVGEVVYRVAQGFLLVIGNVVRAIGKLIDALPFVSGKGIINAGEALLAQADAMGDAAHAMREARDALQDLQFEQPEPPAKEDDTVETDIGWEAGEQKLDTLTDVAKQGTKAQEISASQTEQAVIAIKEEAGVLTKMLAVLGDIRTAIGQLGGFTPVETVTVTPPALTQQIAWPEGASALAALAAHVEQTELAAVRMALGVEQTMALQRAELDVAGFQLEVQIQIRDGVRLLQTTLEEKDFSPRVLVSVTSDSASGQIEREDGSVDPLDVALADNFDRQGRYDGDDWSA